MKRSYLAVTLSALLLLSIVLQSSPLSSIPVANADHAEAEFDFVEPVTKDERIKLDFRAHSIAVNPETNMLYATRGDPNSNIVAVINGVTGKVEDTVELTTVQPGGSEPSCNKLWGASSPGYSEIAVNPVTNIIYVVCGGWDSIVYAISGETNTIVAEIPFEEYRACYFSCSVFVNPNTNRVYLSESSFVYVIDGNTNKVIERIDFCKNEAYEYCVSDDDHINEEDYEGISVLGIDVEKNLLYVNGGSERGLMELDAFNPTSKRFEGSLEFGIRGSVSQATFAVNPDTGMVYLGVSATNLYVINGTSFEVVYDITDVLKELTDIQNIVVNPDRNMLYVTGGSTYQYREMLVIDATSYSVIAHILFNLEKSIYAGLGYLNPATNKVYMPYKYEEHISAVDVSEFSASDRKLIPTGDIIMRPLLIVENHPSPVMLPGRPAYHSFALKNYGTVEGQFLVSVSFAPILATDLTRMSSTGDIEVVHSENNFAIISTSLKPLESKFIAVPIKIRPEVVQFEGGDLQEGKLIHMGGEFLPSVVVEIANLSLQEWKTLGSNVKGTRLIEEAFEISGQGELNFLNEILPPITEACGDNMDNDLDKIVDESDCMSPGTLQEIYDNKFALIMNTSEVAPILADYLFWITVNRNLELAVMDSLPELNAEFSTDILPSSTDLGTQPMIRSAVLDVGEGNYRYITSESDRQMSWSEIKDAVEYSKLTQFGCTFTELMKGWLSGVISVGSLGFIKLDIEGDKSLMKVGKIIGGSALVAGQVWKIGGKIAQSATVTNPGAVVGAGKDSFTRIFTRIDPSQVQRAPTVGFEVVDKSGVAGAVIKFYHRGQAKFFNTLENQLIGGSKAHYIGVLHDLGKTFPVAGGKMIYPGWAHFYYWPFIKLSIVSTAGEITTAGIRTADILGTAGTAALGFSLIPEIQVADPFGGYCTKVVAAMDPNHLYAQPEGYINAQNNHPIQFISAFENLENATAPAYDVRIITTIDDSFNLDTFQNLAVSHPDKLQEFTLDKEKREARWFFKDIELPPNKNPPEGEGWVKYSIAPQVDLATDTLLRSQAKIFFDFNPPISTNIVEHKIDNEPPSTKVKSLSAQIASTSFDLEWEGFDKGSGISDVIILASREGENSFDVLDMTDANVAQFLGESGKKYNFMSIATDKAGNIEIKSGPDTTTSITNQAPSQCLIATAAFGSELTPQVQFLRSFRDNHIMSTAAGSSFMNVFNTWYYSFSPSVADYEREQPWLQQTVKAAIYPLLGILGISEKAYSLAPGNIGSLLAGLTASSLIGAVYFSPVTLALKKVRSSNFKLILLSVGSISIALALTIVLTTDTTALMVSTAGFVLSILSLGAITTAILVSKAVKKIQAASRQTKLR